MKFDFADNNLCLYLSLQMSFCFCLSSIRLSLQSFFFCFPSLHNLSEYSPCNFIECLDGIKESVHFFLTQSPDGFNNTVSIFLFSFLRQRPDGFKQTVPDFFFYPGQVEAYRPAFFFFPLR